MSHTEIDKLSEEIRVMIDRGKSSADIDDFLAKQELTPAQKHRLIQESQEYDLERIRSGIQSDNRQVKYIMTGALIILGSVILIGVGIKNVMNSFLSPIGLLLIFFGYQMFRRNRKLRQ